MISANVTIPPSLMKKLSEDTCKDCIKELVGKVGVDALENVKEFGLGVGSVREPIGGAPHWQGKINTEGHYSGYLSDTHSLKHDEPNHAKIVSSADFVRGVLEGWSTNWPNVTFGPNNYPKRAVDKLIAEGDIEMRWSDVTKGRIR